MNSDFANDQRLRPSSRALQHLSALFLLQCLVVVWPGASPALAYACESAEIDPTAPPTSEALRCYCSGLRGPPTGVTQTTGAEIANKTGNLALKNRLVVNTLSIPAAVKNVTLENVFACNGLTFENNPERGTIRMSNVVVGDQCGSQKCKWGDIRFSEGAEVQGLLQIQHSIFQQLLLRKSRLRGALNIQAVKACRLRLDEAQVGGSLSLSNTQLGLSVKESGTCAVDLRRARIAGNLDLEAAHIRGNLTLFDAEIQGRVESNPVWVDYSDKVSQDLALGSPATSSHCDQAGTALFWGVDFRRMRVSQDVSLTGACFGERKRAANSTLACDPQLVDWKHNRKVLLTDAQVSGDLSIGVARVLDTKIPTAVRVGSNIRSYSFQPICANNLTVGGDVDLSGLTARSLSLRDSQAEGLKLSRRDQNFHLSCRTRSEAVQLDLRELQVGDIVSSKQHGRPPKQTRFEGMAPTVLHFESCENCGPNISAPRTYDSKVVTETKEYLDWLGEVGFELDGQQPYRAFARGLENSFLEQAGRDLRYAAEIKASTETIGVERVQRFFAAQLGGFGLDPFRPLVTVIVFVLIGAAVFSRSRGYNRWLEAHVDRRPLSRRTRLLTILFYSLDRFVPLFTLSRDHDKVSFASEPKVRIYFLFHALVGWAMAAVITASISRLIAFS